MKNLILFLYLVGLFLFPFSPCALADDFKTTQKEFKRVREAYAEKENAVRQLFSSRGVELNSAILFLRAFKHEGQLEVWAKAPGKVFELIKMYDICASSGTYGPKRQEGDGQVPEGFYEINRFNPASQFYLSLGLNYPNASDKILGKTGSLGGDIFIHGSCVTIGCLPLTDDKIKEVYLMAIEAKVNGQKAIPVHIFPFKMHDENMAAFGLQYGGNAASDRFWRNIKKGYDYFEKYKTLPKITVLENGDYDLRVN